MEKGNFYMTIWRNKWVTSHAKSIDGFINTFETLVDKFRNWKRWGIQLLDNGGAQDDYATFITNDMDIAIKAGFVLEDTDGNEYLQTISGKEIKVSKK